MSTPFHFWAPFLVSPMTMPCCHGEEVAVAIWPATSPAPYRAWVPGLRWKGLRSSPRRATTSRQLRKRQGGVDVTSLGFWILMDLWIFIVDIWIFWILMDIDGYLRHFEAFWGVQHCLARVFLTQDTCNVWHICYVTICDQQTWGKGLSQLWQLRGKRIWRLWWLAPPVVNPWIVQISPWTGRGMTSSQLWQRFRAPKPSFWCRFVVLCSCLGEVPSPRLDSFWIFSERFNMFQWFVNVQRMDDSMCLWFQNIDYLQKLLYIKSFEWLWNKCDLYVCPYVSICVVRPIPESDDGKNDRP